MTDQAIAARREYKRAWNARNKDKQKEYTERYWQRKAEAAAAAANAQQTSEPA